MYICIYMYTRIDTTFLRSTQSSHRECGFVMMRMISGEVHIERTIVKT